MASTTSKIFGCGLPTICHHQCYLNKTGGGGGGDKAGVLLHKAFEDSILRSVQLLQPQILDLLPNCLGVVVVAVPVFSSRKVQLESIDEGLLKIGEN